MATASAAKGRSPRTPSRARVATTADLGYLNIPTIFIAVLAALAMVPSVWASPSLRWSVLGAAGVLFVADGLLYGRGAVDMKGAIACKVAAALDYLAANGGKPKGSISFLITGDEEGIAVNGTIKLLKWAAERGEKFDHCILGEPGNVDILGDTIKLGRRGSQNGVLVISGKQGHVAYPHRADNPVRGLVKIMSALMNEPLDKGSDHFDPSNLEFTSIDIGNPTVNLIPGEARARFNIRFNDCHNYASLKALVEKRAKVAAGDKVRWRIDWEPSNADVFYTEPSPFTDVVIEGVMMNPLRIGLITTLLAAFAGWSTSISPESVFLAFFFSASIGVLFGIYPARQASLLNPIEALRHE